MTHRSATSRAARARAAQPGSASSSRGALQRLIRKNRATTLGRYFRGLAGASLAAGLALSSGCADSHFPTNPGEDGFLPPLCDATERPSVVHEIDPAVTNYDYLAAWSMGFFVGEGDLVDEVGVRCGGAADAPACAVAVAESSMVSGQHLVTTDGDTVTRYQSASEVAAFLGDVNTAQEAVLVAWHAGYNVSCSDISAGAVRELADGWEVVGTRMTADCDPIETTTYLLHVSPGAEITVLHSEVTSSTPGVCVGRRPIGLVDAGEANGKTKVAAFFAEIAHLEESAVTAFQVLGHELHSHGAPPALVRAAREAAEDEVRHTATMTRIARRFGAEPAPAKVTPQPVRSLYDIALDNATEGCVRETFGALIGTHQAAAAGDAEVSEALTVIAEDETRHAALSWEIAEWLHTRLTDEERTGVRRARARAVIELRAEMQCTPDADLVRVAGVPTAEAAVALVDRLAEDLWSDERAA
ncbi:MAG: ferritin-like domain-containing protein [Deltaproteobacteria bacterium]|nr:ferritin-like domain-containing protein [Deltaproteobacteria bacterium]